jgi:hypothetical protein
MSTHPYQVGATQSHPFASTPHVWCWLQQMATIAVPGESQPVGAGAGSGAPLRDPRPGSAAQPDLTSRVRAVRASLRGLAQHPGAPVGDVVHHLTLAARLSWWVPVGALPAPAPSSARKGSPAICGPFAECL